VDLVLIRHPAVAVPAGVCYGRSDVALAGDPDAAAADLGRRLAALRAPLPRWVVTSPLARCARVAAALADAHGLDLHADARLAELDFGAWELCAWDAIARDQLDAWAADLLHARAHGGESVAQFAARVGAAVDALVGRVSGDAGAATARGVGASVAINPVAPAIWAVTHSGVMRAIASRALDVPLARAMRWPLEMAAIVWLRVDPRDDGGWRLVRWNA